MRNLIKLRGGKGGGRNLIGNEQIHTETVAAREGTKSLSQIVLKKWNHGEEWSHFDVIAVRQV